MTKDSEARVIRWGGYAALASVVGQILVFGLLGTRTGDPSDLYDASALLALLAENRTVMTTLWWLLIVASSLGLPAVLGFHLALRETKLPLLFGTGLLLFSVVMYLMVVALFLAIARVPTTTEAVAQGTLAVASSFAVLAAVSLGVGGALLALASLDTRYVSKWVAWAGLVGAVVYGVSDTLRHVTGGATVWLIPTVGGLLLFFLIWFAGMGIKMVRGEVSPGASVPGR